MTPKFFATVIASTLLLGSQAFAHSDYWNCAAASGSPGAVEGNCGTRADYDNRQANDAAESQRRQAEQQQQDENDRRARQQRDDDERRYQDDRRRADDEETARRNANNSSYDNSSSYNGGYSSSRRAPARKAQTIPVKVNARVANRTASFASSLDLARRNGYSVTSMTFSIQAAGASTTTITLAGKTVATLSTKGKGAVSKTISLSKKSGTALSMTVKGDITVKTITLRLSPR